MTNQNTISYPFVRNKTSTSRISRNIEGNIVTISRELVSEAKASFQRNFNVRPCYNCERRDHGRKISCHALDQRRDQWPKVYGGKKEEKDRGNLPRSVMRGKSSKLNWVCIARLPSSVIEHAVVFVSRKCHFVCKPTIASTRWKQRVVVALLFTEGEPREKYPPPCGKTAGSVDCTAKLTLDSPVARSFLDSTTLFSE